MKKKLIFIDINIHGMYNVLIILQWVNDDIDKKDLYNMRDLVNLLILVIMKTVQKKGEFTLCIFIKASILLFSIHEHIIIYLKWELSKFLCNS